jgi:predicted metal-dependent HD superfamily phosphohydrolase
MRWTWWRTHRRLGLPCDWWFYNELRLRHAEPQRHYHTWSHIRATLRYVDANYDVAWWSDLARLALFFHDSVYDIGSRTNEARSADLWNQYAHHIPFGVEQGYARMDMVARAILDTAHHRLSEEASPVSKVVNDADMSIMIASSKIYQRYARNIASEYGGIKDPRYIEGRLNFLGSLDTNQLFYGDLARAKATQAIHNIAMEKAMLLKIKREAALAS